MARDPDGLTEQQAKFVAAYLSGKGDASDAYAHAYGTRSPAAIRSGASRLLTNANIVAALERARAARSERTKVTADWVVGRLRREATLKGEGASHAARVSALKVLALHTGMLDGKGPQDPRPQITTIVVERSERRQETEADGTREGGPVERGPRDGPPPPAPAPRPDEGVG